MNKISVIYKDNDLVIVDKPSGVLVVPTPKKEKHTLTNLLQEQLRLESGDNNISVYPCHRLDRDTSGVMVYALNKTVQDSIMQQFKQHKVKKKYIAYVQGRMEKPAGRIKSYIDIKYPYFSHNKNWGKLAITDFKVLEIHNMFSVVEAMPVTGRTNQLRIHFRQIKHPIVGERQYAFGKDFSLKFRRVALHAEFIEFKNPATNNLLKAYAPLPPDMKNFCAKNS